MMQAFHACFPSLSRFLPISLDEMDSIKLMNRVDTKFVTTEAVLERILERAVSDYRVLETDSGRVTGYDSLYFDTPGLDMYREHHNRKLRRFKVRTRTYADSGLTYLEVKRKNNRGRTKKKRMSISPADFSDFGGNPSACDFLAERSPYTIEQLKPSLVTSFHRITLVNNAQTERLTIDLGLSLSNVRTGLEACLNDAVIIELKQDGRCPSALRGILLDLRVKPLRVSKYCIGTVLTDPSVKRGRFLRKIRYIEKLTDKTLLER